MLSTQTLFSLHLVLCPVVECGSSRSDLVTRKPRFLFATIFLPVWSYHQVPYRFATDTAIHIMASQKRKCSSPNTPKPSKRACPSTSRGNVSHAAHISVPDGYGDSKNGDHPTQSRLATIAAELLELVAENLEPGDYRNLRLTCKDIASKLDYVFTKTHFSDRAFLMSDLPSMNTLLSLSMHPRYRESMKQIRLCPARIRPRNGDRRPLQDHYGALFRRDPTGEGVTRIHGEILPKLLQCVFVNFLQAGNFPKLNLISPEMVEEEDSNSRPYGWRRLQAITGHSLPVQRDSPSHHISLFRGLLFSGFETEEIGLGLLREGLNMAVFRHDPVSAFPCANLRTLSLCLSLSHREYNPWPEYVSCENRRRDIRGFAMLMERAVNLEHLVLCHPPIEFIGTAFRGVGGDADTSRLRADVFHSMATKSYLDGSPIPYLVDSKSILLPKLKSLQLAFHQISFELFLRFCTERKTTLNNIGMFSIVDMNPTQRHEDVETRIRGALSTGSGDQEIGVSTRCCYRGSDWVGWDDL